MGKSIKKLSLTRETVRILSDPDLRQVGGGGPGYEARRLQEMQGFFKRRCQTEQDSCHPDDHVFGDNQHDHNT